MMNWFRGVFPTAVVVGAIALALPTLPVAAESDDGEGGGIRHVLLISVDGMHQVDLERYLAPPAHASSAFAWLVHHGIQYSCASTSAPSDSFPGLLAFMTGGSPRSHGVFYDDAYDRTLFPPGSHCTGALGSETHYAENIDYDLTRLDGGGPAGSNHIDPSTLPLRLVGGVCTPVYPHDYLQVNTVMEVIHNSGRRTAWCDKHPAYEIVGGPSGTGLDELYTPEINSSTAPGGAVWTDDPSFTRTYDGFKVAAVLNQIHGFDHTGTHRVGVPALFGMNFQAVSVGQKVTADGYLDASGTPSRQLELSLESVNHALMSMIEALTHEHLLHQTLIVVGAKHGQSPINVHALHMIPSSAHPNPRAILDVTDPIDLLTAAGVSVAQETSDDIALLWLDNQHQVDQAVSILQEDLEGRNRARIQTIYSGEELERLFGDPRNGRTPDIIIQPIPGTIYSGSAKKIAEHGGFAEEDGHVLLVVSNPSLDARTIASPVSNKQVAPTILNALGLDPRELQAVRREGTTVLPGLEE
jgi:hypothetical protein